MTTEHETLADALREQRSRILNGLADRSRPSPLVWRDLPGYQSPVTGDWVEGRVQRREDLKRNGCVEYDPGMKNDAARRRAEIEAKADRRLTESIERTINELERAL